MTSIPDSAQAEPSLIGTLLGGRYRVEALVGMGGMGAVYRAEHVHMRKAVAVKVLHREMTLLPEVVARFEREAVAAGRIEHPHVVAATDLGRLEDGSFYMVLEFVEGQGLGALIRGQGALSEERALPIARQIADALSAAHAADIVHRDLKPENVMLVEQDGPKDLVKVLDFGIAKIQLGASGEPALTQLGSVFGTPEYMAPEQAQGLPVDARADLYAVGLILYEMLSGQSPFRHEELVVTLTRQITMDPPPLPASVSRGTRALVAALLRKNPEERVQTALELRLRLDRLIQERLSPPVADSTDAQEGSEPPPTPTAPARAALGRSGRRFGSWTGGLRRAGLDRPILIAGRAVPLQLLVVLSSALLVAAVAVPILIVAADDPTGPETVSSGALAPDVLALIAAAETGDRASLAALQARALDARTSIEWRAIGHGYVRIGDLKTGLSIHSQGIRAKPELALDPIVVGDIRRAVRHPELAVQALELSAGSLGTVGADLLYDVWEEQKGAPGAAAQRARALLDEEPAKSQRSPALAAVLELHAAFKNPVCSRFIKLLPELARVADERSVPWLARLTERRGCGLLGLRDCYACLRANKDLSYALAAAQARPRPQFGGASVPGSVQSSPKGAQLPPKTSN